MMPYGCSYCHTMGSESWSRRKESPAHLECRSMHALTSMASEVRYYAWWKSRKEAQKSHGLQVPKYTDSCQAYEGDRNESLYLGPL